MRRNLYHWALTGCLLLLWVACTSDEDVRAGSAGSQPIRFAVSPAVQSGSLSRSVVSGTGLPANHSVGIFAYSYASSSSSAWDSTPDLYNNEEGVLGAYSEGTDQQVNLSYKYYVGGRKHAFHSYYPYRDSFSAGNHIVSADLFYDMEPDGTQTDWLLADPVSDVTASETPVNLTYRHVMTMVRVAMAKDKNVAATLKLNSITITTSTSQRFELDIATGELTPKSDGHTAYTSEALFTIPALETEEATQTVSELLLLPDSKVTALSFNVNGEDYATPSGWEGFTASKAGKYRQVNITIGVFEIVIRLGGQNWGDGGTTDLSQSDVTISLGAKDWSYDPATDIDIKQSRVSISLGAKSWEDGGQIDLRIIEEEND